uniref:Stereocilin-like n=1 Tax=Scleropages formosus TaxID=113540 RepID=A0A8C9TF09_SCLFO
MAKCATAVLIFLFMVLLGLSPALNEGESLKTLGILPRKSMKLPSLSESMDRNRLSSFLYNISTYLQGAGDAYGYWDEKVQPRPSFRLLDLFLSLRGSPHWNGLLGLVQAVMSLLEQQSHRSLLIFLSQNWKTISALLDATIQALLSGTYGQASAGIQGFICVLKGHEDCTFSVDWLQQLMSFLETRNWKPVVNLHPAMADGDHPGGSPSFGLQALLLQALSRSTPNSALLRGLDGLRRGLLHRVGSSMYGSLRKKVSRVTVALLDEVTGLVGLPQANQLIQHVINFLLFLLGRGIRHNLTWNAQALGFGSQGPPSRPHIVSCPSSLKKESSSKPSKVPSPQRRRLSNPHLRTEVEAKPASLEILEAACNDSIPGLTGVSNFTVFLYCNLFDGSDGALDSETGHMVQDLHSTCSDAAWYLSAAEEDFLWVHVCSEFFAHEFNNTVCANSSFWLQRAHMVRLLDPSEDCLEQLGARSLSAQDFRECFLPNNSALIASLCGNDSSPLHHEGGWAAEYCIKLHNSSTLLTRNEPCDYKHWEQQHFANSTLLQLCTHTDGLKDHICKNATLFRQLATANVWLLDFCMDPEATPEASKCFLQWVFDMLPAPYDFDTSQLCVNPAPFLLELLYRLSQCEGSVDDRVGWLGMISYVLRVLDFVVGLSAGLEEGEGEVRQGLAQAILLSSLLDNTSFWATLRPNASLSVLHTVRVFLRKEQDPSSEPHFWL